MRKTSIIVLAAGKSKRMKSSTSKVLHTIANRPLIDFINEVAFKSASSGVYYVCSKELEEYIKINYSNAKTIIQKKQLGTAHAVECVKELVPKNNNNVIVLFGDVPLIKQSTIKKLIKYKNSVDSVGTIVTFVSDKPFGYGRVITNNNYVRCVVEEKDATSDQKKINLCNSGIFICDANYLFKTLKRISNNNTQKERYLTAICKIAYDENKPFSFFNCDEKEVLGVNSQKQLIDLDLEFQRIYKNTLIKKGVTLIQPETIRISYDTKISKDVIIEPNTIINKNVEIKNSTKILSGTYLEGCIIGKKCVVGPYARIRPFTKIEDNVKIGNFVEIKNSRVGQFSSISHLSYVGDALISKKVNIGAGTITCNYDGYKKNKTEIGENVFIGSNSSLIAPIKIKKNSIIGAGSVVTKNVPISSLAIARPKLVIKKNKKKSRI